MKRTFFGHFQLLDQKIFFIFARISLLTALSSLLFAAFSSTPGFDTLVNYDTAWTYVYDGGKYKDGSSLLDIFHDVKCKGNGVTICVGGTIDTSNNMLQTLLMKFDNTGKILQKKLYQTSFPNNTRYNNQHALSIFIAKNGDFLIGGIRYIGPYIMRTDSLGNLKWATWYYDSVGNKSYLKGSGTVNSIKEASNGNIICAVGDEYPVTSSQSMENYAALLIVDSLGKNPFSASKPCYVKEYDNQTGYNINGFYIEETANRRYLLSGNQNVYYTDTLGNPVWRTDYSFWLEGVGTMQNNVIRAKVLRDNTLMVAGQAYERNCWTLYQTLYYDAWWSPIQSGSGAYTTWDTAGEQRDDDKLYDFTQLKNGTLVFIGRSGNYNGIWAFVTDSSGKKLLWQKDFPISYHSDPADGRAALGYSVCSTDDGGFTLVGELKLVDSLGGENGLVAHFIPKPESAVIFPKPSALKSIREYNIHVSGSRLIVSDNASTEHFDEVALFDISGKRISMHKTGANSASPFSFDISKLSFGTYFVRLKSGSGAQTMKICLNR
jgi:hypothetical protein